ncbi:low molecular weight phosphotyrosine protein phosphatase [Rhizobium sp. TRM95111]|uniref:low molecular weight protein-tyrosine-phosphatase n=1 Tax=Rhizobium alarense TaxID=2846851 RepID=UPI001F46736D|nr:low molecular weight protein-tyrosine-phosphatase [Rhizobium alarense]MCF3640046.1 low molecular weight phosphotyrosine protein phosphatase [Rhizobium alarense]
MVQSSILFVCLGNICRSPLGEGVLRHLLDATGNAQGVRVASAGLGPWHVGDPPDSRAIAVARGNGVDISGQRGRQLSAKDFESFDHLLAMDRPVLARMRALAPAGRQDRIALFSDFAGGKTEDVPDPYYGGPAEFDAVYRMIYAGCSAIAAMLAAEPGS